ncbi:hypothetical protein DV738_g1996, partial [Chaetothyriales sp. CBS 135597]
MSTTTTTTRPLSVSTPKPDKARKGSRVVILRLQPEHLAQFAPKPTKDENAASSSSEAATPVTTMSNLPTLKIESTSEAASDSNSTPAQAADGASPDDGSKKRKAGSSAPKRSIGLTVDGPGKSRSKPGPKKKPKLDDGTTESTGKPATAAGPSHRLGPKAAEKAINAGLRALDRSGTPCRRWIRKPFQVKSFTGVAWDVPSWKGGEKIKLTNGDNSSEIPDASQQSTSDVKPEHSDIALESSAGDPMAISTPIPSSPPPVLEQASAISAHG